MSAPSTRSGAPPSAAVAARTSSTSPHLHRCTATRSPRALRLTLSRSRGSCASTSVTTTRAAPSRAHTKPTIPVPLPSSSTRRPRTVSGCCERNSQSSSAASHTAPPVPSHSEPGCGVLQSEALVWMAEPAKSVFLQAGRAGKRSHAGTLAGITCSMFTGASAPRNMNVRSGWRRRVKHPYNRGGQGNSSTTRAIRKCGSCSGNCALWIFII